MTCTRCVKRAILVKKIAWVWDLDFSLLHTLGIKKSRKSKFSTESLKNKQHLKFFLTNKLLFLTKNFFFFIKPFFLRRVHLHNKISILVKTFGFFFFEIFAKFLDFLKFCFLFIFAKIEILLCKWTLLRKKSYYEKKKKSQKRKFIY